MIGRDEIIRLIIVAIGEGVLKVFREFAVMTTVNLMDEHGCAVKF